MKLNIGIIGTRGIPNKYGGFEQFAQYLSVGLLERGHDMFVYSSHTHPYQQQEWNGVKLIHCKDREEKMGTIGQFFYDRNCITDARKRNFDILLHLGYSSDSIWHSRWPKAAVNIMNMDGLEWKRSKYNWLTRRFLTWAEKLAAKNADILVADSVAIQDHLQKSYHKNSFYIPYGADIFTDPAPAFLERFNLIPHKYFLLIARMEPENNIEIIIKGYINSGSAYPLVIIGNISNRFGRSISARYNHQGIIYAGAIYDAALLNNLRYHSLIYFHGHSVGGTNPSLLEAMACECNIAAHDNVFNKAVLQDDADYFLNFDDVASKILSLPEAARQERRKRGNLDRISTIYSHERIIDAYEKLMLEAVRNKQ